MKSQPHQDPRQMMQSLDTWYKSLASKMNVDGKVGTDKFYLIIQAISCRYECILCRLILRTWQQSEHLEWRNWAKQRLNSAFLELDTVAMRVMTSGTLEEFPMPL